MQRALEFLYSDEAKTLPKCYGSKKSFDRNLPCGAETSNREWSERVQSHMVQKMELEEAIETWNDNKRGFTKQLGRSFVARSFAAPAPRFTTEQSSGVHERNS